MKKRGAVEIQFNWILILIAGAIILGFFTKVGFSVYSHFEDSRDAMILSNLKPILTDAVVGKDVFNPVELPKAKLKFSCGNIELSGKRRTSADIIIFAPTEIPEDTVLYTWSQGWNVPYRASNFLYLTNKKVRYIVVGAPDNALRKLLQRNLPENLRVEWYDDLGLANAGIKDKNDDRIRIVYFYNANPPTPSSLINPFSKYKDKDVTLLSISDSSNDLSGEIKFYKKNKNNWGPAKTSQYLGTAALYGAIFSDDAESYECAMRRAFTRYNQVNEVYLERSKDLAIHYLPTSNTCFSYHNTANDPAKELATIKQQSAAFPPLNILPINIISLKELNNRAELASCEYIY